MTTKEIIRASKKDFTKLLKDYTGYIFGNIKVLELYGYCIVGGNKMPIYRCECQLCHKIEFYRRDSLGGNHAIDGCRCERKPPTTRLEYGGAALNSVIKNYRQGAKVRGLIYALTREQFKILTSRKCYYCNASPSKSTKTANYNYFGEYIYNGIDRINNELGYILDNCVSCCYPCNSMKGELTQKEFFEKIQLINSNLKLSNLEIVEDAYEKKEKEKL